MITGDRGDTRLLNKVARAEQALRQQVERSMTPSQAEASSLSEAESNSFLGESRQ